MIQSIDQQFHFVSIVVKKGKNPGTTTFHRPSQLSFPDYFVALVQNLRHKTTPTTVILQNLYRPSIEDADANPTVPSFRRVRLRAADWPRDSSSEFFEKKKLEKKKFYFGRKKTGSDRLKRTQQQFFIHLRSVSNLLKEMTSTSFKPDSVHADSNRT